jgi:putative aminopeptidase FrvX
MHPLRDIAETWDPAGNLLGLIKDLSSIAAPAGNEDRMTLAVGSYLAGLGLEVAHDRLGQLAVSLGPEDADTSVMISAHLDELGLVVRSIEANGWLRVHRLGGLPERVLPAARVVVHCRAGDFPAVVGVKSHHLTSPEEKYVGKPATDLYLDLGLTSCEEVVASGVRVGDPITYAPTWDVFNNSRFAGKSLDNRLGVAAVLDLVRRLQEEPPTARVHVAFSCQEEFNIRGTLALAARFQPDIALVVDITPATDTPDLVGDGTVALGAGPSLSRMSFHGRGTLGGLIPHPALVRTVERAAERTGVSIQYDAVVGVVTDAAFLPMAKADGIAVVGLGIPCRYTHSPVETAQLSDVEQTAVLLAEFAHRVHETSLDRGECQITLGGMA